AACLSWQDGCVHSPTESAAVQSFVDAVSIWRLTDGAVGDIIDAATDCLVEGIGTPSLSILAGESARESRFVLEPMIEDAVRELGRGELLDADAQRAALGAMLRRFRAGTISARDLARWAHRHIGHDGEPDCQIFVELDDIWDEADCFDASDADLNAWMAREADAFWAGRPSPGWPDSWRLRESK
ncbi:MAG TPA: hypothetical protein VGK17_07845, partial [Propionicimonas sp.]